MNKIALVEDNPDNRLLMRVLLEERYALTQYETGADAWAGLRQSAPDVVLLDISLPDMDGTQLLRMIRGDGHLRNLPVVALTAHAMVGDREKFLALGFDDYVSKPVVDENVLLTAIERAIATQN